MITFPFSSLPISSQFILKTAIKQYYLWDTSIFNLVLPPTHNHLKLHHQPACLWGIKLDYEKLDLFNGKCYKILYKTTNYKASAYEWNDINVFRLFTTIIIVPLVRNEKPLVHLTISETTLMTIRLHNMSACLFNHQLIDV